MPVIGKQGVKKLHAWELVISAPDIIRVVRSVRMRWVTLVLGFDR
jgi:hypothetical protein